MTHHDPDPLGPHRRLAPVGILAPMERELAAVLDGLSAVRSERVLGRTFYRGVLHDREVVAVIAGIGKTAVATTTTMLIERYAVASVLLIGLAGRVSEELAVGDVVVATHLVHHDLDASPIFPRYEVPALGISHLETDAAMSDHAFDAAERFLTEEYDGAGRVVRGLILSGDQFIKQAEIVDLRSRFPDALAVEMEGAAVAQVCIEAQVACSVVRSISDDGDAGSFTRFLAEHCDRHAHGIVRRLLEAPLFARD